MAKCGWLLISVLLISVVYAERECSKGLLTPGYTDPHGDILIEYGDPLDIICVLNDNYTKEHGEYSSKNLYFVRDEKIIPSEMIEILNSSSIRLHIEKPPKSSSVYTCKLRNGTQAAVCFNNVIVGTKPLPVEDFECIGYNYENLTCTWTAPENFAKTTYTLKYFFPGRAGRYSRSVCPKIEQLHDYENQKKFRCFWTIQTDPPYRQVQRTIYFELNMTNYFGSTQINHTFSHFQHVLSGPPDNLTAVNTTSESVYLRWSVPISMQAFPPGLQHRILYQSQYEKEWQLGGFFNTTHTEDTSYVYFNLTNLKYAHTLYDIRVSMRSVAADPDDEFMWSKNSSLTIITRSRLPGRPPVTNIGSFEVVSSGNTLNQREVFIYWQQIPQSLANGPNFTYAVEVIGRNDIELVEVTDAYAKFRNLSVYESYTFDIWSQNSVGRSKEKSVVVVPSQTQRVDEPLSYTKIAFGDGKYELSWKAPKRSMFYTSPVEYYTIFWCTHDRDRPYQCTGYLSWIEIPSDKKIFNITVSEDKIHQFAISANTNTSSSGMVWAACTVIHNQAIGKMKNVQISQVYETAIQVSWKLECSDRVGSVEGFVIYYCSIVEPSLINCIGPEQSLVINDTTAEQVNITGLKPYKTYMLAVSVITKHNSQSQKSDYQYATTLEGAPSPPYDLKVLNVTNSSISISWSKPDAINGKMKYYRIIYNNRSDTVEAGHQEYTINDLYSYVIYNLSVVACTSHCSAASPSKLVRTLGGYPGKTSQPGVTFQNNSFILVEWDKPEFPRGKNDIYEVSFKEKLRYENRTNPVINVTRPRYGIEDCGGDGKYNSFYVSVRAINFVNGKRYEGPWSDELESFCLATQNAWVWLLIPLSLIFVVGFFYLGKKMYFRYREMRNVEVTLPPGLTRMDPTDMDLTHWGSSKIQDDASRPPSADEELLLVKRSDSQNLSGDSSGCSSGHESVTSSSESGTLSNSSDSGTEQPRSASTEDLHKNSLRLRNVSSNRPVVSKGYVTMPTDNSAWNAKTAPGNYCSLDSVPVTSPSYVPAAIPQTEPQKMPPYVLPDASNQPTPYVLTGDLTKPCNSGYVPLNPNDPVEKNSAYVMAGNKISAIPDVVRIEPYKSSESEEKPYVQVADAIRKPVPECNPAPADVAQAKGYVTIGEISVPRANSESSKAGYIPHRQFDAKTIKED
ncbi:hypothetical protein RN001_015760 [Aquatica leii]|uniref:Fibronectin type-III domain-containing protein n=1 Tax=Aquatica leii TaxID=1421715 RepID=A0AAN7S5T8_9COLE|nr:hypothetical protein RN001_015760 [Aquatica leii]